MDCSARVRTTRLAPLIRFFRRRRFDRRNGGVRRAGELGQIGLCGDLGGAAGSDLGNTQPVAAGAGIVAAEPADVAALQESIRLIGGEAKGGIDVASGALELVESAIGRGAGDESVDAIALQRKGTIEIADPFAGSLFPR